MECDAPKVHEIWDREMMSKKGDMRNRKGSCASFETVARCVQSSNAFRHFRINLRRGRRSVWWWGSTPAIVLQLHTT
jgi:hypothetical protein